MIDVRRIRRSLAPVSLAAALVAISVLEMKDLIATGDNGRSGLAPPGVMWPVAIAELLLGVGVAMGRTRTISAWLVGWALVGAAGVRMLIDPTKSCGCLAQLSLAPHEVLVVQGLLVFLAGMVIYTCPFKVAGVGPQTSREPAARRG